MINSVSFSVMESEAEFFIFKDYEGNISGR